jgi:hypothetical protein
VTWEERRRAVSEYGYTERQAGFLVTVMLHAGVCLGRNYCAFAGIAYGQKMHDFFRGLVDRGHVSVRMCGHNTARLYHVHAKPLYAAIGEPNNRNRKPLPLSRAVERLMLLDAVLADREVPWLATERDKLEHFTLACPVPRHHLPALVFRSPTSETVRYFPDKLPVGLSADGRTYVLLYLVTRSVPVDFRAFLERHAELLRALPRWTLRILLPHHLTNATDRYRQAFHDHLAAPLRPDLLEELRWFFLSRAAAPTGDARYRRAARAFGSPRFRVLYRAWMERGERVLDATLSPVLADAIGSRRGQLECHVLPHRYLHLLPLVGTA